MLRVSASGIVELHVTCECQWYSRATCIVDQLDYSHVTFSWTIVKSKYRIAIKNSASPIFGTLRIKRLSYL